MASKAGKKGPPEEEDDSDIEVEGMDLDEEEEETSNTEDVATSDATSPDTADDEDETLAQEELKELEEVRKERQELIAAEQKKLAAEIPPKATAEDRLKYIMAQSDVFAHFLAGSVAATAKNGKKGSRGKKGRLTEAEEDARLLKAAQSKRHTIRLDKQPSNLASHCKMHAYQLEGLNWLIKLHDHGINGILADEMGLGKTLQTISLLAYLRESRGVKGPHLVVVPKSVVGNWIREFKMWCPSIRAIRMGGTKAERQKFVTEDLPPDEKTGKLRFDVLVTSYEGLLKEKGKFSRIDWSYLVIDEAHRIKNEHSSLSKVVRTMNTQFRILITGTPLQNNLHELWALLNFLLPDIFGDAEQFDEWFSLSDDGGKDNVIKKLHTVLRPFMLRRVKKDVAGMLPPKKETKLYVGLTPMQQEWYKKVLQKQAFELNSLGGPDRVRLLNVLMQLRKVCNHPYLFDGAEPGPPYSDGPHLWENSGKMMLLHKLLPKLKNNGSRVLIFSQMTRVLDILEDYFRFIGHGYCRIDGNTDGEKRDSQMEEFNAEGSDKFAFLLSTRAGGLGINLATADIVILYDSDWNPQVDLQAMDRAHRIGQKKPVQVFRFISEGTVEEKIIERADRKLFLDAAVIQQGRLAEQNSSLEKDELMRMVKFGADQMMSGKGGTYTDEDIDALIAKGEEKTSQIQAKLQTDAQHNLANFSLLAEDETVMDTFDFGGKNWRGDSKNAGNFINLPQRERKRNYDVDDYFRQTMSAASKSHGQDGATKKRRKGPSIHDYQLFDKERLDKFAEFERQMAAAKEEHLEKIKDIRTKANKAPSAVPGMPVEQSKEYLLKTAEEMESQLSKFELSKEQREEKAKLLDEGFPDWSRKDFKTFCSSLERHGRYDLDSVVEDVTRECGKEARDVKRYFVSFWTNYRRISGYEKIVGNIERGEKKILRLRQIRDAIQEKVERHLEDTFGPHYMDPKAGEERRKKLPSATELLHYSWPRMKIKYGTGNWGKSYQEEEDAFLICMMYRHGYGAAERIRMEIRRAWQFRFDWYFKSRNSQEIQKRCDMLVKIVERENEEVRKKEQAEALKAATGVQPLALDEQLAATVAAGEGVARAPAHSTA
jgi:SWI/SNF-related matrix-associated actin-dependent regulator of chromatin subfamily A member 5